MPSLSGGGIPTSIGILRGLVRLKWAINLVGVFLLSLVSFFIGVPLGTEGPSVQMGTAAGMGSIDIFSKKHKAWERYSMTGGACAGFSVATGSPISGILFSIEEAHQRISPMILIVSATSVIFSFITSELLSPLLNISSTLFPKIQLLSLSVKESWIPLIVGLTMGLFAVLFLKFYNLLNTFFNKKLKTVPYSLKIFFVFSLSLALGLYSFNYISTGHELILSLFENRISILFLFSILIIRSTLTLSANTNRITGGVFIPILAIGAVLSAILAQGIEKAFGLSDNYYSVILVLGITACISGMMKMPLTAIAFSVEALSAYNNILYVIIVSVSAFIITEIFDAKSINDSVLDNKIEEQNHGKTAKVIDTYVTVKENSFAVGKQIRDIFWPANLFVLSIKHTESVNAEIDEHGGKAIRANDILHVRYSTFNEALTKDELIAIVGE
jgi:H+/Cl- antiporter ClcA